MSINQDRLSEEVFSQRDVTIDREEGVIRGAMLCQTKSRNKRLYSPDSMQDLERLYEGVPIRLEHDKKEYLATVGAVINVKYNRLKKQITGDLSLNKGHANYEQIMEDAEKRPHLLALSHEVPPRRYEAHRDGDTIVVDRIHHVDCMAIVTDPGVNKNLFESVEDQEMEIKTVADLKANLPSLYEEVRQEGIKAAANDTKLAEAIAERDTKAGKIDELNLEIKKLKESVARFERTDEIRQKAKQLEVQCSDELMEALVLLDGDDKVEAILKSQPKLKEDVNNDDSQAGGGKPRQKGGVTKPDARPVLGSRSGHAWLQRHTKN